MDTISFNYKTKSSASRGFRASIHIRIVQLQILSWKGRECTFFHMLSFATMTNTKVNMKRFLSLYSYPVVCLRNGSISNKGKSQNHPES